MEDTFLNNLSGFRLILTIMAKVIFNKIYFVIITFNNLNIYIYIYIYIYMAFFHILQNIRYI